MTEAQADRSAGAMLRKARLAQGMDVATLAAAMKVTPQKIELLEADRFGELHGAAYVRALAQSVSRCLKIDPVEVLELLPRPESERLDQINQGLNTPFKDRPGHIVARDWSVISRPMIWGPALLVLGALLLYMWPSKLVPPARTVVRPVPAPAPAAPASAPPAAPTASATAVETAVETVYSVPPRTEGQVGSESVAAPVSRMLQLSTTSQSWVEVLDAQGRLLISRTVQPGEAVGLDGALPLRLKIGNSAGTRLVFRGELVELAAHTRDNVAKLELK